MREELERTLIRIAAAAHGLLLELEQNGRLVGPINGVCIAAMEQRLAHVRRVFEAWQVEHDEAKLLGNTTNMETM